MAAGAGICHSEVSTAATTILDGFQLWVAFPEGHRDTARAFEHHVPEPICRSGYRSAERDPSTVARTGTAI
jgi:redox-sensitive bicupin YhaK (pirin superfamily)